MQIRKGKNKMTKVGVVVLNFINYEETIQCVESIIIQKNVDLDIVVVDNGSPNESYKNLVLKYSENELVNILKNNSNLGYARGNNVGINFLRSRGCQFIVVCNSDVEFSSNSILKKMIDSNDSSIGVMIPIIKNLDGSIEMRAQYRKNLFTLRVLKELLKMQCIYKKDKININTTKIESLGLGIQNSHYAITGSVFALTPSYFKYYNGLFSRTFLYVEELATLLLVHKAGLKTAIIDTDDVIHKGAASTSNELKSGTIKKKKMIAKSARKVMMLIVLPRFIINKL